MDDGFDFRRCDFLKAPNGAFDGVRQHDNGGFFGSRFWAGIPKFTLGWGLCALAFRVRILLFLGLMIKRFDECRAVVRLNELAQYGGQAVFLGDFDAVFDVPDDDQMTHFRREFIMPAGRAEFILDEIAGLVDFSNVVVIGAHPAQKTVASDGFGGRFGNRANKQTMAECAGRFHVKSLEQSLVGVAIVQERHARGDSEGLFDQGKQALDEHAHHEGNPCMKTGILEDHRHLEFLGGEISGQIIQGSGRQKHNDGRHRADLK